MDATRCVSFSLDKQNQQPLRRRRRRSVRAPRVAFRVSLLLALRHLDDDVSSVEARVAQLQRLLRAVDGLVRDVAEPAAPPVVAAPQPQVHELAALPEKLRERALVRSVRLQSDVGVEFKGVRWRSKASRSGIESEGCAERCAGKTPQGSAFTTPTRSYVDQCIERTRFRTYTVLSVSPWSGRRSMFAASRARFALGSSQRSDA